jgi:hypothetical protein
MIGIISTLVGVAADLHQFALSFKVSGADQRDRIAKWMSGVGLTLQGAAEKLRAGEIPHGSCAQLALNAELMPEIFGKVLSISLVADLQGRLLLAHNVESLMAELGDAPNREQQLRILEETGGRFVALGKALEAGWKP